ncbi:MAG: hypothetical protein N2V76_02525 [Methanophagales archaeon]|nr:hypothetical protein [Methanophagales archaeon]
MAIKTILSITPAIFTGPTPCFAISCLTRRELTALIIFPNSTHFGYKPQYKFFGFVSPGIGFYRFLLCTFRSEIGAEYYQYIASVFATWWLQREDVYDELKKLLVNVLLFEMSYTITKQ